MNYKIPISLLLLLTPFSQAISDLRTIPGLNEAQQSLAIAIHDICPKLAAKTDKNTNENNLFMACKAMIQTSNEIQNSGDTTSSLGLTLSQLITALKAITPEEAAATGSVLVQGSKQRPTTLGTSFNTVRVNSFSDNQNQIKIQKPLFSRYTFNIDDQGIASSFNTYANIAYNFGDKKASIREDAYEFKTMSLLGGMDLRLATNSILGIALSYNDTNADINSLGNDNTFSSSGLTYILYWNQTFNDSYINFTYSTGKQDLSAERSVPAIDFQNAQLIGYAALKSATTAKNTTMDLTIGHENNFGSFNFTHYGKLSYQTNSFDAYNESGNSPLILHIDDDAIESLRASIGMHLSHVDSFGFGVVTEFLKIEWLHESKNKSRNIEAYYVYDPFADKSIFATPTEDPDRDFYLLSAGFTSVLPNGIQAFLSYENIQQLDRFTSHNIIIGGRLEF